MTWKMWKHAATWDNGDGEQQQPSQAMAAVGVASVGIGQSDPRVAFDI
jgi:hypothetical protein